MTFAGLAVLSSTLQVLGYWLYIRHTLREETNPNPSSWLMWAYGTFLIVVLELGRGASWEVLLMPTLCATCSIFVAYLAWQKHKSLMPSHRADWTAFIVDIALTIGYIVAVILAASNVLDERGLGIATLMFLVFSNATTVTTFTPMVRNLWQNPHHENPSPWLAWSAAYTVLALATWYQYGLWSEFIIYPIINLVFHPLVFWLSHPARRIRN